MYRKSRVAMDSLRLFNSNTCSRSSSTQLTHGNPVHLWMPKTTRSMSMHEAVVA